MRTIAFFSNGDSGGRTSLVYHLAWMYADLGVSVVVADLNPQADLTSLFVDESRLQDLWSTSSPNATLYGALPPVVDSTGDSLAPHVEHIADNIGLLPASAALSTFEDALAKQWHEALIGQPDTFRVLSGLMRTLESATDQRASELVLMDVGSYPGALTRAALIAADHVVIPLSANIRSSI